MCRRADVTAGESEGLSVASKFDGEPGGVMAMRLADRAEAVRGTCEQLAEESRQLVERARAVVDECRRFRDGLTRRAVGSGPVPADPGA